MVIPSIPIALSASLTSSSLCGCMMASIFFMVRLSRLRFEIVSLFAMHADVEALELLLLGRANSQHKIADLENDERSHDGQAPGDQDRDSLIEHLAGLAVHQTEREHLAAGVF